MLNRIRNDKSMTHMPFLTNGPDSGRVLFFCRAGEDRIWKLHLVEGDGHPRRIVTGFADEVIECSPTAWHDETGWHVSFIAGGASENPIYHLCRMDGPALDRLSQPVAVRLAKTGFVYRDRMAIGEFQDIVRIHESSGDTEIEIPGAYIYRVAYRADATEKILVTGHWINEDEVFTLEYDLTTDEQRFIECDGKPAYKCTILGDEAIYADRVGEHFESRSLRQAETIERKTSRIAARRWPDVVAPANGTAPKRCGCGRNVMTVAPTPVRPSCLECVEKHLGAAYVLLAETADGYAHRLRAIGHFHEAEDESQEWPTLHQAIRSARKAYQTDGRMPDWESLGGLVQEVRDAR